MARLRTRTTGGVARTRSGAQYTQLRVDRRIEVDVQGLARHMGDWTIARIRELAAKGRGREGSFEHLRDSTIERYESEGIWVQGTRSTLRKTGKLLDGLWYSLSRITLGATKALKGGEAWRVVVQGAKGGKHPINMIDGLRPFMGLSRADFRRATQSGPEKVKLKSSRPIGGKI